AAAANGAGAADGASGGRRQRGGEAAMEIDEGDAAPTPAAAQAPHVEAAGEPRTSTLTVAARGPPPDGGGVLAGEEVEMRAADVSAADAVPEAAADASADACAELRAAVAALRVAPVASDTRECVLCRRAGDGPAHEEGRLLPFDPVQTPGGEW